MYQSQQSTLGKFFEYFLEIRMRTINVLSADLSDRALTYLLTHFGLARYFNTPRKT